MLNFMNPFFVSLWKRPPTCETIELTVDEVDTFMLEWCRNLSRVSQPYIQELNTSLHDRLQVVHHHLPEIPPVLYRPLNIHGVINARHGL
jgi:hypothetical protein